MPYSRADEGLKTICFLEAEIRGIKPSEIQIKLK